MARWRCVQQGAAAGQSCSNRGRCVTTAASARRPAHLALGAQARGSVGGYVAGGADGALGLVVGRAQGEGVVRVASSGVHPSPVGHAGAGAPGRVGATGAVLNVAVRQAGARHRGVTPRRDAVAHIVVGARVAAGAEVARRAAEWGGPAQAQHSGSAPPGTIGTGSMQLPCSSHAPGHAGRVVRLGNLARWAGRGRCGVADVAHGRGVAGIWDGGGQG